MRNTPRHADNIKWLKFAILLSQTNFDELTEGQRLDLKNTYREFLRSAPYYRPGGQPLPLLDMLRGRNAPAGIDALIGEDDVDEKRAKTILAAQLQNLAVMAQPSGKLKVGLGQFTPKAVVTLGIGRDPMDQFYFMVLPTKADDRILALLGYHLSRSGVTASMLRKCPQCTKVFLASRKPRIDRDMHCSTKCSGIAASRRHQARQKIQPQVKNLLAEGKTVDEIAQLKGLKTPLDLAWLQKQVPASKRRRAPLQH